jgi:hypothetical protein
LNTHAIRHQLELKYIIKQTLQDVMVAEYFGRGLNQLDQHALTAQRKLGAALGVNEKSPHGACKAFMFTVYSNQVSP